MIVFQVGQNSANVGEELGDFKAQLGHGTSVELVRNDVNVAGNDVQTGQIGGSITLTVDDALILGDEINLGTVAAETRISSQIGHGASVELLSGATLAGGADNTLTINYGSILEENENGNAEISGNTAITVLADSVNVLANEATQNSSTTTGQLFDNFQRSQIGHGNHTSAALPTNAAGDITSAADANITGVIASVDVDDGNGGTTTVNINGRTLTDFLADPNFNAALGQLTAAQGTSLQALINETTTPTLSSGEVLATNQYNIDVTENRIAGDIDVSTRDGEGDILLSSTIQAGLTEINRDVMIARIGHGSQHKLHSLSGDNAIGGGYIRVAQAHILGADISVNAGNGGGNQDVKLETSIAAGLASVTDNTAVAQIGHSGDIFAQTGNGGGEDGTNPDGNSADGGDITIIRGTIWDGSLVRDNDGTVGAPDDDDNITIFNTTNITVTAGNEIIIDSDTSAALASADRNNSEAQIGHGFKTRLDTGNGGTSAGTGAAGGAGGDVLIYQGVDVREYGIDQNDEGLGTFDDYAYGIRGDISVSPINPEESDSGFSLSLTSDDTSALAATNFNSNYTTLGHGDIIEITTGDGGDGSTGLDFEGDDQTEDPLGQVSVAGGRGGHIDVQLGRPDNVGNGTSTAAAGSLIFDNRDQASNGQNQADTGDTRAQLLDGTARESRQGVSLTEGDIRVTAFGPVNVAGTISNALSPSNNALVEANIGHATRVFADSGNGGNAGSGNFNSQSQTVLQSEQTGEEFLNYASSTGSNRGGNGGDIRVTQGDITDRNISDRIDDGVDQAQITHDTDADHSGVGESSGTNSDIDNSADISIRISDSAGSDTQTAAESLIVASTINAGLSENNGDINSGVGHRVRLFAEAGAGGEGGSTNTEFDADGNSLFENPATGQTDTQTGADIDLDAMDMVVDLEDGADGFDETATQAGAVFNQPNGSGGRGGDALTINGNISGDVVVEVDRAVSVTAGNGHGGDTKVFASIGHTTDAVALTQAGGDAGDLLEPPAAGTTFDGGIINVGGGSAGANEAGDSFAHVLIDGNQDDQFNLTNIGDSQSISGEDGVAVTPEDIDNRTGSTFASINNAFGTLDEDTGNFNADGAQIFTTQGDGNNVIFHDEEADPNFILDNNGNFVANSEVNNQAYAENTDNLARFGRVVSSYDGLDNQPNIAGGPDENFFSLGAHPGAGAISLEVFVDTDRDGDVDLVDFDRDGRIDIVDVDRDGVHDVIDGRANYVDITNGAIGGVNDGTQNEITGLGVLDYVAVTGVNFNETAAAASGEAWSNQRELRSTDLLSQYNDSSSTDSDFTSFVSDFATANGGRGGDAYTQVGYSIGDVSVSTGSSEVAASPDSLIVATNVVDSPPGGGDGDNLRATIGHSAFQVSDSGLFYEGFRAGREGLIGEDGNDIARTAAANGGDAGYFAVNGNGGRGGNADVRQGAIRDLDGTLATVVNNVVIPSVNNEFDHLVGRVFINTPNALDNTNSTDAGRISITSNIAGAGTPGDNNLLSVIGHSTLAGAFAVNTGGNGASLGTDVGADNSSSQTEIADGGDGGDASILQRQIKGTIEVRTASDDIDGTNDQSLLITVDHATPSAGDNLAISQIGHERQAFVNTNSFTGLDAADTGGTGGNGDDGQFRGNGGAGGDATITQERILDTGITVDLVVPIFDNGNLVDSYDGNGALIQVNDGSAGEDILRAQVGNADLAFAISGNGGNATDVGGAQSAVIEQRNQTANGGDGGDAIINQAGYNYDITLDIGSNESAPGASALEIITTGTITNTGGDDHLLAAVGHGGFGEAVSGNGGEGGDRNGNFGITAEADPNLVDTDFNFFGAQTNGDTPFATDIANEVNDPNDIAGDAIITARTTANAGTRGNAVVLGTTRRGGDAGDAIVNLGVGGTGNVIGEGGTVIGNGNSTNQDREFGDNDAMVRDINDFGINNTDGADIIITTNDEFSTDLNPMTGGLDSIAISFGNDGVLIQAGNLPGSNQDSPLFLNAAIAGHHSFGEATSGTGGNGIQTTLSAQISDGDGGDGGNAITTSGAIRGDVDISNTSINVAGSDSNNSNGDQLLDTNIVIETVSTTTADTNNHRADARAGHLTHLGANAGDAAGGDSANEAGAPPSFPASVSVQGGDGGDALTFQGQLEGDVTLNAENSVIVRSVDGTDGTQAQFAAVGHRTEGRAFGGEGGFGGTYNGDNTGAPITDPDNGDAVIFTPPAGQTVLFTYEALREFHARRTGGFPDGHVGGTTPSQTDAQAFAALSEFEQQLVAPVTDYFENKPGELEVFLDRLIGDEVGVIANNNRDDNFLTNNDANGAESNFTVPSLVDGDGHIVGADDGEIETLSAILAASGHGGNASVVQGSVSVTGQGGELSANGDINLNALGNNTDDGDRGIIVEANAGSTGNSFQGAYVGHQAEARDVIAGNGQDVEGDNAGANGIGGDGGDAIVDQYAANGGINLESDHRIRVSAIDAGDAAHEVRAFVGHRLTVGPDYTVHRALEGGADATVIAGNGGDEESVPFADGHNGNGGDVFIYQRGVVSGTVFSDDGNGNVVLHDTEISLAALEDSDNDNSIIIEATEAGIGDDDVETHIGHDFLIHGARAGDAGRQAVNSGPVGGSEGLLEGNGGDIFIAQTNLGADIDIVGRDQVEINVTTDDGADAHLIIGHERTIGNAAEGPATGNAAANVTTQNNDNDGNVPDNPRAAGTIIAGFGGDAFTEDVNGTALDSREAAAAGIIEDADSGRIEIALGTLGDSLDRDATGNVADDERFITITSITEDVDITSVSSLGSNSILEIGNQQQVIAETQSAGELQSVPFVQTAGDAGSILINRADISGDILIQAIDAERGTATNGGASDGDTRSGDGRQVVIETTSTTGSNSILQVGHETEFTASTANPVTARAGFGEDRNFLFETNLQNFVNLDQASATLTDSTNLTDASAVTNAITGATGQATLRDAQNAVEDIVDVVRALELAIENADRFPVNDNVDDSGNADNADQGELFTLLTDARTARDNAQFALGQLGVTQTEEEAVNNVQQAANSTIGAATAFQQILDGAVGTNDSSQIADFAESGDIVYGGIPLSQDPATSFNRSTATIPGVDSLNITSERSINAGSTLIAEGFNVTDTGVVRGNVTVLSGRDDDLTGIDLTDSNDVVGNDTIVANNFGGTGFTGADDLDDSVVIIRSQGGNGEISLTELGHRRFAIHATDVGGGDTDASPEEGGLAGDGGSIITRHTTSGDVNVSAEEVVITALGGAGLESEVHLLHSQYVTNNASFSDIQTLVGNGGDISNTTSVSGGATINAEQIASDVDAGDRKLLATGAADSLVHFGHQVEDVNLSQSDPNEAAPLFGDSQDNLGSNRGGFIVSSQTVAGAADGDLVTITLDAAGDGNASDLVIETGGTVDSDIRLGNGEDGLGDGIANTGISGNLDQGLTGNDDGGIVTLTQNVSGDIELNTIEDLEINAFGTGDQDIRIGHDANQLGSSGQVNTPAQLLHFGERVTGSQTITGDVNINTTSTFTADLGADANELHIGHEGTQDLASADDSANPTDFEDNVLNANGVPSATGDGIADGVLGGNGPSAGAVNDNFDQPDVLATQTIEAGISIVTGEITLNSANANRLHVGHEAFINNTVDGDLTDNIDGTNPTVTGTSVANGSTGHVVSSSIINGGGSDILFQATGVATAADSVVNPTARTNNAALSYGANGDIQLTATAAGEIQVGHRSTSTQSDGPLVDEGQYNTLQAIGSPTLNADGTEVANTAASVIEFQAAQDIILSSETGETQVGHYITESADLAAQPVNVDGNDATGLAEGDSELRQIVGSDIIFGDNSNQGSGGVGANGAGNNVIIETTTGRTIIGHQSPETNASQNESFRSVTVQLLDGDITVEAGTDVGVDAPDGAVLASAAAALANETGLGDDLLILSGGGVSRIGHNIAGGFGGGANVTQRSAGDISVRTGGDLHVLGGQIGHENYDIDSTAVQGTTATPEFTNGPGALRDRIRGNTTIGAGQNSSVEDSTLQSDILLIDGSTVPVIINSGYGGQGDADVDGELRFFLPAQEGLTIVPGVVFNDSASNNDAVPARTSNSGNVFEAEGGLDHEHPFEFFSENAQYLDGIIGPGNFGFYFEQPLVVAVETEFTPFLIQGFENTGFQIIFFDDETGTRTAVNVDGVGDYLGTSSLEIACQEAGLSAEQCARISERNSGIQPGLGSNVNFSAQSGGNVNVVTPYTSDELSLIGRGEGTFAFTFDTNVANSNAEFSPSPLTAPVNDVSFSEPSFAVDEVSIKHTESFIGTAGNNDYDPTAIENTYGSYVSSVGAEEQITSAYPGALSYSSSYLVFEENTVN